MNILNQITKALFGEKTRRARISKSNREYRAVHGDTRRVPVYEMGRVVDYVYLQVNRTPGKLYKEIQAERRRLNKIRKEKYQNAYA